MGHRASAELTNVFSDGVNVISAGVVVLSQLRMIEQIDSGAHANFNALKAHYEQPKSLTKNSKSTVKCAFIALRTIC
jgi:hypothetical protein